MNCARHSIVLSVCWGFGQVGSSGGRLVGIAKGAGMIEPDMATMLVYLVTDLQVRCALFAVRCSLCAVHCALHCGISVDFFVGWTEYRNEASLSRA